MKRPNRTGDKRQQTLRARLQGGHVENLITSMLDESPIVKQETRASALQPTKCQPTNREILTIKDLTVEQTKATDFPKDTTQVGLSESELQFDPS